MITDKQKDSLVTQYYDRGILKKEIRSYEVSLWTLQDEFITVLKWSDVEQKGRIEHPKMTLNIDGTEKFTFSIPMYYRVKGELVENPNWYTVREDNLIKGMRKVKVIFNKGTSEEDVFEFLILNVTENHESDILTCEVECEGLAFQELGKIGYKVNLSMDNFDLDLKDWLEKGQWIKADGTPSNEEPKETVDYWCEEAGLVKLPQNTDDILSRTWYYDIRMSWSSMEGASVRLYDQVYEEPYTSSWDNYLKPIHTETYAIKQRSVSVENSNLYNITQTIAESFKIYCRYKYLYDDNYHIVGRVVIFYNNFFEEDKPIVSLQYPYSAKRTERTIDSTNITTKLYVLSVENDTSLESANTIMNTPSNASREDYILNFDHMYKIGAINQEQYDAIKPYEIQMRDFNDQLIELQQKLTTLQKQEVKLSAKKTIANNSVDLDNEQILQNKALYDALDNLDKKADGYIQIDAANADYLIILTSDTGEKYINLNNTNKGIKEDSIEIYNTFSSTDNGPVLTNPITGFIVQKDEYNNPTRIVLTNPSELQLDNKIKINWNKVFKAFYTPANYNGNVNLMNRKIVPSSDFVNAGYSNFDGTYGTLYGGSFTPLNSNGGARSDDGKIYDIMYTPVQADGTVLSDSDMISYLDTIIAKGTNIQMWMNADKKEKSLFLGYIDITSNPNSHEETKKYVKGIHEKQAVWDQIRAQYNWFGYQSNPSNIAMETIDVTSLSWYNNTDYVTTESTTSNKVYLAYKYQPRLYYDNVINMWKIKLAKDTKDKKEYTIKLGPKSATEAGYDLSIYPSDTTVEMAYNQGMYKKIDDCISSIKALQLDKKKAIAAFDHMMGPALREGYWQPEDYSDYGERKSYTSEITSNDITVDTDTNAIIAWDSTLFDDEDTLYYQIGVDQTKEYYPCIDLNSVFPNGIPQNLSEYSLVWKATSWGNYDWNDIHHLGILSVGSKALIRFLKINNQIKPVLMMIGAKTFSASELERMIVSGSARLELYSAKIEKSGAITINHGTNQYSIENNWLCFTSSNSKPDNWSNDLWSKYTYISDSTERPIVYPRIKISSLALKTDATSISINYGTQLLTFAYDYYINTRDTERNSLYYLENYITIKPEVLVKYTLGQNVTINYVISNANTAIYLDAKKISEENAKPKVSYNIETSLLNVDLTRVLYNKLAQIVMINDAQLKLEDAFGYISELELDLDAPQNDSITIQNYTTKFEDLFSTIVAQTEEMKKMGGYLSSAMNGGIGLSEEGLQKTLSQNELMLTAYLDSYFDSSQVVRDRLLSLFTEAGEILADSNKSLNRMQSLTLENADILTSFARNISEELSGQVYRSTTKPSNFKQNDVWIQTDDQGKVIGRYLATASSEDSGIGATSGFVRTYDGTLASISGAAVDFNADTGVVDITAQNEINIKSGNSIYIAANENVEIVGNKKVNIGGTEINLCTLAEKKLNPITGQWEYIYNGNNISEKTTTGINLVGGEYRADENYPSTVSRILIKPDNISIGAAKMEFVADSQINLITSRGAVNNTSAVHISSTDGIFIGTGAQDNTENGTKAYGIRIFGGEIKLNNDGSIDTANTSIFDVNGASMELNKDHLILGYMEVNKTTGTIGNAIEMTKDYMILASGSPLTGTSSDANLEITGEKSSRNSNSLVGAKFTRNSIGFATQSGTSPNIIYNAFIMNDKGLTLGSSKGNINLATSTTEDLRSHFANTNNGSFVRIAADGIELGSLADLYINTDNFKLQTHSRDRKENNPNYKDGDTIMAIGKGLQLIQHYDIDIDTATAENLEELNQDEDIDIRLVLNQSGLYLKGNVYAINGIFNGTVYASGGSFTGNVTATSFTLNDPNFELSANKVDGLQSAITNNTTVVGAKTTAEKVTTDVAPIVQYGLIGYNEDNKGKTVNGTLYNADGYPTHHNTPYGLILGNSQTLPMLIGSNGGIHIINYGGTASAIVLDHNGISIASGGNFDVSTNNLLINSNPTSGNAYLRLGPANNAYLTYDSTGLTVKGEITATSLTIASPGDTPQTITQYIDGRIPEIDPNAYATWRVFNADEASDKSQAIQSYINGRIWNDLENTGSDLTITKEYIRLYKEVSSTPVTEIFLENELSFETFISASTWSSNQSSCSYTDQAHAHWHWYDRDGKRYYGDGTHSNAQAYITSNWLYNDHKWYYFNADGSMAVNQAVWVDSDSRYYKLDRNGICTESSITLNQNGIEMYGKRLRMNGEDAWGRDDIVIMNPNDASSWRHDVTSIESHMAGKHDWVLIRPYYNAALSYLLYQGGPSITVNDQKWSLMYTVKKANANSAFGDGAGYYKYEISFSPYCGESVNITGILIQIGSTTLSSATDFTYADNTTTKQVTYSFYQGGTTLSAGRTNDCKITFVSRNNFSGDGEDEISIYIKFIGNKGTYVKVHDDTGGFISFSGECDSTDARVPCTVYYYP